MLNWEYNDKQQFLSSWDLHSCILKQKEFKRLIHWKEIIFKFLTHTSPNDKQKNPNICLKKKWEDKE